MLSRIEPPNRNASELEDGDRLVSDGTAAELVDETGDKEALNPKVKLSFLFGGRG